MVIYAIFSSRIQKDFQRKSLYAAYAWLGKRFLNRTFSPQEDDPIVDVDEIIEILDAKLNDSSTKRESNPPYL